MSEVCHWNSEANFYGFSLWEFGKGPCHHFLPYLNDTASYTFKLSLRMYICSVNHNTDAQVVFWEGGKKAGHTVLDAGRLKFGFLFVCLFFDKWRQGG